MHANTGAPRTTTNGTPGENRDTPERGRYTQARDPDTQITHRETPEGDGNTHQKGRARPPNHDRNA